MEKLENVKITIPKDSQNVRTTFSITRDTINRINRLSEKFEMTAKKVIEFSLTIDVVVEVAIELSKKKVKDKQELVKKVYAIKSETRDNLNEISKENKIPRDRFIMELMKGLEAALLLQEKREKESEEKALEILHKLWQHIEKIEEELKEILDEDSPILYRYITLSTIMDGLTGSIELKLKEGTPIDPDEII